MTLTNRLLAFFLTTLAIVLIGFSISIYLIAGVYWQHQTEIRLNAMLDTLRSALESEPAGLEWEPSTRHLQLGFSPETEKCAWIITHGGGEVIDQGGERFIDEFLASTSTVLKFTPPIDEIKTWRGGDWLASQEWIDATYLGTTNVDHSAVYDSGRVKTYRTVAVTVGVSLESVRATLRTIAWILTGLSTAIWLVALVAGRSVCRWVLRPIVKMADAAESIGPGNLAHRMPRVATADELGRLTKSFDGLLDRVQLAFERQKRFTTDASHQLRTPLTAILGQIDVTCRRERSALEYRNVLQGVRDRAAHLSRIVEALLFLARADAESQLPDQLPIDLVRWLPDYLLTWQDHPRFAEIHLDVPSQEKIVVLAHSVLLSEFFDVLVDNALKYTAAGQPIRVQLRQECGQAMVRVIDAGIGISASDLLQVGRPFFRGDVARKEGISGVGLGLSIARRLAKVFRGELQFESQLGSGTTVTVVLPIASPQ